MAYQTITIPITPAVNSDSFNFAGAKLISLITPAAWTTSTILFQVKSVAGVWTPLHTLAADGVSTAMSIAVPAASIAYRLDDLDLYVDELRLVAGTAQAAARAIEIHFRKGA